MTTETRAARGGGRAGKRAKRSAEKAFDAAWRNWVRPYPPIEQFSACGLPNRWKARSMTWVEFA